jgi:hypothetical protein
MPSFGGEIKPSVKKKIIDEAQTALFKDPVRTAL